MSRILILFSNPADTERLRLDKEHRAIDEVLRSLGFDLDLVCRKHATTFEDFLQTLSERPYDVIQFSGHGSGLGFCFESPTLESGDPVKPKTIARALCERQPQLKVAMFIHCYSASSISDLIDSAPYLITVQGAGDDALCTAFVRAFYGEYLRSDSIESAFARGHFSTDREWDHEPSLNVVLSRRILEKGKGRALFRVYPNCSCRRLEQDSIVIDLTEAETDIARLGILRDEFLATLSRKVRVHRWIFASARERAFIPIGSFCGEFSWVNASDVVTCHRLLKIKETINQAMCDSWTTLLLLYNDRCAEEYRSCENPADKSRAALLKTALEGFGTFLVYFLCTDRADPLRGIAPSQYVSARSQASANFELAKQKFLQEDFTHTVIYLETALSAIHDLINGVAPLVIE